MSLFNRSVEIEKKYFSKEEVIRNIRLKMKEKAPLWNIIDSYNILDIEKDEYIPDILCIRSVIINKEISIKNLFSDYRRTVPSVYQILVGAYINQKSQDECPSHKLWRSINVNSAEIFFMKLNEEE